MMHNEYNNNHAIHYSYKLFRFVGSHQKNCKYSSNVALQNALDMLTINMELDSSGTELCSQ